VGVVTVVAQFVLYVQGNEQEASQAYRESQHIDESVPLVPCQVPQGDGQVVFEHNDQDVWIRFAGLEDYLGENALNAVAQSVSFFNLVYPDADNLPTSMPSEELAF
jgi:hypothetical protein